MGAGRRTIYSTQIKFDRKLELAIVAKPPNAEQPEINLETIDQYILK